MSMEKVEVLVVGAGQAGLAASEHLGNHGVPHLVLERHRIAERWRSERWDSLVANGPAWHDRFPGMEFPRTGPDGFPSRDEIVDYFDAYARRIEAPVRGGATVDFRRYAARGMVLVGRTERHEGGRLRFAPDLAANVAHGDAGHLVLLDEADAHVAANGLDLPEEPAAREIGPDPDCVSDPVRELDLEAAGITSIVWATGYVPDYSWLAVGTFDAAGKPVHQRGVSTEPGLYFLGLPWQSRRGSSFIWGVWHDAKFVADHVVTQRGYRAYRPAPVPVPVPVPAPGASADALAGPNARRRSDGACDTAR